MYSNTPNPPSKFTATMWGKTVTIELDHSDIDLNELMDIFKGLTIASGFEMVSWNNVIKDTASQIYDEEHEIVKDALDTTDDECNECNDEFDNLRHSYEDATELENDFFGDVIYENDKRMDIIGQNGNEGLHYDTDMGADEDIIWGDENELETPTDDYKGIHVSRPTFDWDGETNDILLNINDSITLIKDRMEDIDMRMDNIDEQIGVLNADVANIEFNIEHPLKRTLLNAKEVYDKSLIESGRQLFQKQKEAMDKYNSFNDVVDWETGEVSVDGGFDGKKLNKSIVKKGKIKDLKK